MVLRILHSAPQYLLPVPQKLNRTGVASPRNSAKLVAIEHSRCTVKQRIDLCGQDVLSMNLITREKKTP